MTTKTRPGPWLETLRLELGAFVEGDFEDVYRLDSDPRVMKYIADGKPSTRDAAAQRLERFIRYPRLYADLGAWRASRRENGAFVGWFALNYAGKSTDIEVGYRLLPAAWGRGLATEGAKALVHYGFDDLVLNRIIGVTHPGNKASQRLRPKAGLRDEGWGRYYYRRLRLFALAREEREK